MSSPRLLAIMGSGEMSPSMVRVHRDLLARLGPAPVRAVMLDTPAAFQENVADLGNRAVEYFATRLAQALTVLSPTSTSTDDDPLAQATALARLTEANYVFAGPGSPSYALHAWAGSPVPALLAEKLARGGCLTFASAAALTLGVATVPVYEIYKVGAAPHWLPGLDLLGATGLRAAVVPHFDNAEGGNHDTRFCYLGERRLAAMESLLPAGAFVLGVDEHTACVLDVGAGTAEIIGRGGVTVRAAGASQRFAPGTTVAITELADAARRLGVVAVPAAAPSGNGAASPTLPDLPRLEAAFAESLAAHDLSAAVRTILAVEDLPVTSGDDGVARERLRTMVVRLGEAADGTDRRAALAPLVDALLAAREQARAAGAWGTADALRDALLAGGVEVRDGALATQWALAD